MNLTDHLLIAMPQAPLESAVIYICQHSKEGAMGLITNHATSAVVRDILREMQVEHGLNDAILDQQVMIGGPNATENGYILHTPTGQWRSSLIVNSDTALTTSQDILQQLGTSAAPSSAIFCMGYVNWGPGELEEELSQGYWLMVQSNKDTLFKCPPGRKWDAAAKLLGILNTHTLSGQMGHA